MINVFDAAYKILIESNVNNKIQLSRNCAKSVLSGQIEFTAPVNNIIAPVKIGRPDKPILVSPENLTRRNLNTIEGRAAMVHSFAHIEFNAINLAWDLIYRFRDMPDDFYIDWTRVADEESKHFIMLRERLIKYGYDYGDFPAHDGLWRMAEDTAHDILLRLAVIPRILEARGLDVTPNLINRFEVIKDDDTVSILKIILKDEIGHVSLGSKWYRFICKRLKKDPDTTFKSILKQYAVTINTKKINEDARLMAGFSYSELEYLTSI